MASSKTLQAIVEIAGSLSPTLGKAAEEASKSLEGINLKAVAVGAGVAAAGAAIGKATIEAGKYLVDLGGQFDNVVDTIRIGTGATGDALDALTDDFNEVYKSVPTTMEDASQAIADYNTRLGLTGPELQNISKQAIQVSDAGGRPRRRYRGVKPSLPSVEHRRGRHGRRYGLCVQGVTVNRSRLH